MGVNVRYALGRALSPSASLELDTQSERTLPADVLIALGWVNNTCPDNPGLASLMLRVKYGLISDELPQLYREIHNQAFLIFCRKRWITGPKARNEDAALQLTPEMLQMHLINSRIHSTTAYSLALKDGLLHKRVVKQEIMDAFVRELMIEWIDQVCRECKGRGEVYTRYGPDKCPECLGNAKAKASDRGRARAMGMWLSTFQYQRWDKRFLACRAALDVIEKRACRKMGYHLIDEDEG